MSLAKIKDAAKNLADVVKDVALDAVSEAADNVNKYVQKNKGDKMSLEQIVTKKNPVPKVTEGEIVVLPKGANIQVDSKIVTVACGIEWDEVKVGHAFDADVSCLTLGADGKAKELIYFGSLSSNCKNIIHTGDNLTGADDAVAGVDVNDDDETIMAQLNELDSSIDKVVFFMNIYDAQGRNQNFGTTGTMKARLYEVETGHVFMTADLMEDNSTQTSMLIGEFYRKDGGWKYKNMAQGGNDTLEQFVQKYK